MTMPNPLQGVVVYLVGVPEVFTATGGRVFGSELPKVEASNMPRPAVVVSLVGGGGPASDAPEMRATVDVACYGATPKGATDVYLVVREALRGLRRSTNANALLHTAVELSGPMEMRDEETRWPLTWSSWRVVVGERVSV